jgi:3'-phosphoadenosine 5'-phosphosulfate sulfotransferase (PAPS reductase)/FAD synthetase
MNVLDRIAEGARHWSEIIEDRPLLVSVSGGKDSTAMALWLIDQGLADRCHYVFADTGWEHPDVYKYLEYLENIIGPIHKATNSKYPGGFADLVRKKGMFPSRKFRFCTEQLKVVPIREYAAQLTEELGQELISCVGIRAAESRSRAALDMWDSGGPIKLDTWRPIIEWGVDDVIEYHNRHNVVPCSLYLRDKHPASRVGCYPCIMSRKKEICGVAEQDSWRIDEIRNLELEVQEKYIGRNPDWKDQKWQLPTMFQGRQYKKGERPMTPIDEVVEWSKTSHGGHQYPLIEIGEPGCRMWGLCDMGTSKDDE